MHAAVLWRGRIPGKRTSPGPAALEASFCGNHPEAILLVAEQTAPRTPRAPSVPTVTLLLDRDCLDEGGSLPQGGGRRDRRQWPPGRTSRTLAARSARGSGSGLSQRRDRDVPNRPVPALARLPSRR